MSGNVSSIYHAGNIRFASKKIFEIPQKYFVFFGTSVICLRKHTSPRIAKQGDTILDYNNFVLIPWTFYDILYVFVIYTGLTLATDLLTFKDVTTMQQAFYSVFLLLFGLDKRKLFT